MRSIGSRIRIQSVEEVRASLDTFGDGVIGRLDASRPAAEPDFSYRAWLLDVGGRLASVEEKLVAAEDAHVRQLIRIAGLRRQSQELTAGLYRQQVAVRRILEGLFGPERGFELAAIQGPTPQELKPLSDQVGLSVQFLVRPAIDMPPMRAAGVAIDFTTMAGGLKTDLEEIVRVGDLLDRARKGAGQTVVAKQQATAEFDALFPWAAQALESVFRMAGERDLADRLRTSRRRVTRRQKVEVEDAEATEPSTDGTEAPPSSDS